MVTPERALRAMEALSWGAQSGSRAATAGSHREQTLDALEHPRTYVRATAKSICNRRPDFCGSARPPTDELSKIWRNTTQWLVWDSPVYERDLKALRRLNETLPRGERVRVVLGDPAIPWSEVRSAQDFRLYEDRNGFFAEATRREVLAKGRRGLLVYGNAHCTIMSLPATGELMKELGTGDSPRLIVLSGTGLGERSYSVIAPKGYVQVVENGERVRKPIWEMPWPPRRDVVDGLLWLGGDKARVDPSPEIYLEPAYQSELRRRAAILSEVHGVDLGSELQALADEARSSKPH